MLCHAYAGLGAPERLRHALVANALVCPTLRSTRQNSANAGAQPGEANLGVAEWQLPKPSTRVELTGETVPSACLARRLTRCSWLHALVPKPPFWSEIAKSF